MKKLSLVFLVLVFALVSNLISAQVQPVDKDHLAIGGYDVVSYFTANKPQRVMLHIRLHMMVSTTILLQ